MIAFLWIVFLTVVVSGGCMLFCQGLYWLENELPKRRILKNLQDIEDEEHEIERLKQKILDAKRIKAKAIEHERKRALAIKHNNCYQ